MIHGVVFQAQVWRHIPSTPESCRQIYGVTWIPLSRSSWRWSVLSPKTLPREPRRPFTAQWSHRWRRRAVDTTGTLNLCKCSYWERSSWCGCPQGERAPSSACCTWNPSCRNAQKRWFISVFSHSSRVFAYSDCAPANCSAAGKNDELAQKLWELSCRLLSITWEWGDLDLK